MAGFVGDAESEGRRCDGVARKLTDEKLMGWLFALCNRCAPNKPFMMLRRTLPAALSRHFEACTKPRRLRIRKSIARERERKAPRRFGSATLSPRSVVSLEGTDGIVIEHQRAVFLLAED